MFLLVDFSNLSVGTLKLSLTKNTFTFLKNTKLGNIRNLKILMKSIKLENNMQKKSSLKAVYMTQVDVRWKDVTIQL